MAGFGKAGAWVPVRAAAFYLGKAITMKLFKLSAASAALAAICLAQPVCAGGVNTVPATLTLTEVSNTQLKWAWDALGGGFSGSITAGSADQWLNASISGPNLFFPSGQPLTASSSWAEPENPTGFKNTVSVGHFQLASSSFTWTITVNSDVNGTPNFPDGFVVDVGGLYNLAFFDKGDAAATVPDTPRPLPFLGFLSWAWPSFAARLRPNG